MGMFAVKNDKGEWLGWEVYHGIAYGACDA